MVNPKTATMNAIEDKAAREVEAALKVIVPWLAKNRDIKIVPIPQGAPHADIHKGILYIPPMNGIANIMTARAFYFHESLHCLLTKLSKSEQPTGALFSILNSLEDCRIEWAGAAEHEGCKTVFNWATDFFNKRIAKQITTGEAEAPLWEALCAMSFMVRARQPAWTLTEKAQVYVDAAYEAYRKVTRCKSTKACLKLAKEIYELLKQAKQGFEQEQEKSPNGQPQDGDDGEGEEQDSENQQQGQSKDDGETQESQSKDDGEEQSGEGEGSQSEAPADIEDEDEGEGNGSDGAESDDDSEANGAGDDGEGEDEDDGESAEGDESDSGDEGKGKASDKANDSKAHRDDKEAPSGCDDDKKSDEEHEAEMDEEAKGEDEGHALQEELKDQIEDAVDNRGGYTSLRENDEINVPKTTINDNHEYDELRRSVSSKIMGLSRALEQALRTLSRTRKDYGKRAGEVDLGRLVDIAKRLADDVYFQTRKGQKLDTAVSIVIDESGSMGGGQMHNTRLLAIALGECLTRINVPFEMIGSTTKYSYGSLPTPLSKLYRDGYDRTNPLVLSLYKSFGETWARTKVRTTKMRPQNHNIDGEVVELCARRLSQRRESRKVILSLSDGEPCGGHGNNQEMAKNLIKVCEKVRKAGIEVYGFGIGTEDPEEFYGKKHFVFLKSVEEMGHSFFKAFAKIITKGRFHK